MSKCHFYPIWTMKGDGIIYLGKTATPDSPNAIHYHIL
jgi:hypothetical protein